MTQFQEIPDPSPKQLEKPSHSLAHEITQPIKNNHHPQLEGLLTFRDGAPSVCKANFSQGRSLALRGFHTPQNRFLSGSLLPLRRAHSVEGVSLRAPRAPWNVHSMVQMRLSMLFGTSETSTLYGTRFSLDVCHSMECFYFRAALDIWDVHSMERVSLRASLDIWDIHSMKRVSLRAVLTF